jgi:hypothetical protein
VDEHKYEVHQTGVVPGYPHIKTSTEQRWKVLRRCACCNEEIKELVDLWEVTGGRKIRDERFRKPKTPEEEARDYWDKITMS